jgi:hypothetical protein
MLGLVIIVVSGIVWMASGRADHNLASRQMVAATTDDPAEIVLAFHSAYYAYKVIRENKCIQFFLCFFFVFLR